MSVLGKKWVLRSNLGQRPILEVLLENRGLKTSDEKERFLSIGDEFSDPFEMKDMEKSVSRIMKAIKEKEHIMIFGDYDVDGLTSAAIVYHALKHLGANHSIRLPNREKDGYGLSKKFIDEFIKIGVKLIITVDCGISSIEEIAHAQSNGIETIITDHHQIPEKFPHGAYSIVHPKLQETTPHLNDLTGAGVALKLAQGLLMKNCNETIVAEELEKFVELAALGTIADLGAIHGENRLIVKKGLKNLMETSWPGIRIIKEFACASANLKEITPTTVGFQIAPRINAAGRIGDPTSALKLLIGTEEDSLYQYGKELEELNLLRQQMTINAFDEANQKFLSLSQKGELPYILVAESENWHVGILGLSASKLVERFGRPAIVMQDLGEILVGSARSLGSFNIIEALTETKDLMLTFGGHKEAAGFNIKKENLNKFKTEIEKYAERKLKNEDLRPVLELDCELNGTQISEMLIHEIGRLRPFGIKNPRPLFKVSGCKPTFVKAIGRNQDHLKFEALLGDKKISAIGFRLSQHISQLKDANDVELACHIEINEWNGNKTLQLEIIDFNKNS